MDSTEITKIPDDIKLLITDDFLHLFRSRLEEIFPYEIDKNFAEHNTGCGGWYEALYDTSRITNKHDIEVFFKGLNWEESDICNLELGDMLVVRGVVV